MATLTYIELNVFAFTILLIVYLNFHNRMDHFLFGNRLFLGLLYANAALLILDTVQWASDGVDIFLLRQFNIGCAELYYILNPVPCLLWSLYADHMVYRDSNRLKKLFFPLMIPFSANLILTFINLNAGMLFYIDQHNVYHRGSLFFLLPLLCYIYLIYTLLFILKNQKKIEQKFFIPLLVFVIPPIIGGILQSLFYGVSLVWVCMTLSILIIFLNLQDNELCIDHLTGLYNRRLLDSFLQEYLKENKRNTSLAAIMIDLDAFKNINDQWGHTAGDDALIDAGKILKASFKKSDLICRYGGDEFVALLQIKEQKELDETIRRIKEAAKEFNETNKAPYNIGFSMGYDIFDDFTETTVLDLLNHIDCLMYEDKKQLKQI